MRNRLVLSYRRTVCAPTTRFIPARACRRNSRYADWTARLVAIRSGTCSSAPQARHQSRRSLSEGGCTPCSILLTRVKCWPVAAARTRPERPASLRISRSRAPSASWACRAELDGGVLTVRYRQVPHGLERRPAQPQVSGLIRLEHADPQAVPRVQQENS